MADVTYYFDENHATVLWTTTPVYMIDNVLTNYANTTVDGDIQTLIGNTCPGTDLGTISKIELRAYGYGDADDQMIITPIFTGGTGDPHIIIPGVTAGWKAYQDITIDINSPVTVYEYVDTNEEVPTVFYGASWVAQGFTPATTHNLGFVSLLAYRYGNCGDVTVSIRATDVNGRPTGEDLASGTIAEADIPTDYAWITIRMETPVSVIADTKYAIVVRAPDGSENNTFRIAEEYLDPDGPYAGGHEACSNDSGSSWTDTGGGTAFDFECKEGSWAWSWTDVDNLDCNIELNDVGKGNTLYCSKVEIRVTYTVTGNYIDLAGASAASATINGLLKRKRNFIGEVIASSQINGILKTNKKLLGTINALSQTNGILKRTRNFAGAIIALSQIDGVLRAYKDLVGEVIALSQTDCILKANKKLSGAVNALSQIDAILKTNKKFSGAIDAQSQTSAIWKISKKFSGAVSALSQIDGILQTKAFKDFIGTVSALSQTDAFLARTRNFSGATDALSQVDGNLTRILALQGFVDTISQTDANIKVNKKFQGAVSALSQIDGILKRYRRLTGNVNAQSQTDALLKIYKDFIGAVDALSEIDGFLYTDKKFIGAVLALSETSGLIKINKKFAGSVEALSDVLGSLTIEEGEEEEIIRKFILFYGSDRR